MVNAREPSERGPPILCSRLPLYSQADEPDTGDHGQQSVMHFERLKRALSTNRGLHLTFSSGRTEQTVELSLEAADQVFQALQIARTEQAGEDHFALTVLGHQTVRTPEAYGLLLCTRELGNVVFSLPRRILRRLITDLMHLASSDPELRPFDPGQKMRRSRSKAGTNH